jgi:hypothetical protein
MTAVSSNGVGFADKDNVDKEELGPMHFALDLLVGHDQRSRIEIGFAGTSRSSRYLPAAPRDAISSSKLDYG